MPGALCGALRAFICADLGDSHAKVHRQPVENLLAFPCCLFCKLVELSSLWPVAIQVRHLQLRFAREMVSSELDLEKRERFFFRGSTRTVIPTFKKKMFTEPNKNVYVPAVRGRRRRHLYLCVFKVELSAMISGVRFPCLLPTCLLASGATSRQCCHATLWL